MYAYTYTVECYRESIFHKQMPMVDDDDNSDDDYDGNSSGGNDTEHTHTTIDSFADQHKRCKSAVCTELKMEIYSH